MKANTFLVFASAFAAAIHPINAQVFEGGIPAAQAAVTEAWVQRYSNDVPSGTTDQAVKVVRDATGDIIVTGSTAGGFPGADMLTIKYSGADGSVLWQQRYNGPANGDDRPSALAVDGSGNVVVTGTSGNGTNDDYYTAKYAAADGALLWEKRYNNPVNDNDEARAVAVDGSGNVVVTGYAHGTNRTDYYTAKYAAANGALLWEKRYNGPTNGYDQASAVAVDGSGNVVVTGASNYDYYTAKYAAADGALLWEKRYNGPLDWDHRPALAVDGSGNVVVTGFSYTKNTNNDYSNDYYTAKYAAADGALLWEKRYDGPANSYDEASALAVDGSGNVVVTGRSWNGTNDDYYTAKYAAADGTLLWEKRYNGPANIGDIAKAVTVDDSDNVVVTGYSDGGIGLGLIGGDYYTAKYAAADGVLLWERRYDGPTNSVDYARAVTVDASGNVVVTGHIDAENFGLEGGDYYTAKYAAADGAPLWGQRYHGSVHNDASAQAVAVDGSGNVAVTGVAYNWGEFRFDNGDYYTAKYAAVNGALLWEKRYNGPANGDDQPKALAVDGSGNVVVTGRSNDDYYTAKYAAVDGAVLWEKRYNGPANRTDQPNAVAVDGIGNVVVTGSSIGSSTNHDYYTAKYAAADGALLWEKRYNHGSGTSVAVDGSGNVVVTGHSGNGTDGDYYTAKYAAADGAPLWETRYNGPGNGSDEATALAVDGNGDVVVTGNSWNGTNGDYYTAKYAAADGALLWEKRYNHGYATSVAVDGSGNVVVTGHSFGSSTNSDYYTAKYAAADGALLWEKRYNGPGNGSDDRAKAVAVDGSGNVVVTGSSVGNVDPFGDTIYDFYTAKYAAADGALLWEKRFNRPGAVGDSPHGLALGPDGMVVVTGTANGGYATVVYREVLPPVSIDLILAGVRLRFTGVPGRSYSIERAPALTGWSTIHTQITPASGLLEYLDALPHPGSGFYRIVQP